MRTDGQKQMTKLTVGFHNFADAPKNYAMWYRLHVFIHYSLYAKLYSRKEKITSKNCIPGGSFFQIITYIYSKSIKLYTTFHPYGM